MSALSNAQDKLTQPSNPHRRYGAAELGEPPLPPLAFDPRGYVTPQRYEAYLCLQRSATIREIAATARAFITKADDLPSAKHAFQTFMLGIFDETAREGR